MSSPFKLTQIDRRHAGTGVWEYFVEPAKTYFSTSTPTTKQQYHDWRKWCWETWGASKDLDEYEHTDMYDGVHCSNPYWCWRMQSRNGQPRLYFRSSVEASAFALRWS